MKIIEQLRRKIETFREKCKIYCLVCGKELKDTRARFCSEECKEYYHRQTRVTQ